MISFVVQGVRTHVVATTVCATEGVHALTCCTLHSRLMRACTRWLKGNEDEKGVCLFCACHNHPHLAFLFDASPFFVCSVFTFLTVNLTGLQHLASYRAFPAPQSRGKRTPTSVTRSLATWPSPPTSHLVPQPFSAESFGRKGYMNSARRDAFEGEMKQQMGETCRRDAPKKKRTRPVASVSTSGD